MVLVFSLMDIALSSSIGKSCKNSGMPSSPDNCSRRSSSPSVGSILGF